MRRLINKLIYTGDCEEFYTDDDLTAPVMKIPWTLTANVRQLEIHGTKCQVSVDHQESFRLGLFVKKLIGHIESNSASRINYEVNFKNRDFVIRVEECEGQKELVHVKKIKASGISRYEIESSTGQSLNVNGGGFHSLTGGRFFSTYGMFSPSQPTITFLSAVALCQIHLTPLGTGTAI